MRTGTWTVCKLVFSRQQDEHGQSWPCLEVFGVAEGSVGVGARDSTKRLRLVAPPTVAAVDQRADLECVAQFLFRGRYGARVASLPGFGRGRAKLNAQTYSILLAVAQCSESGVGLSWKAIAPSWPDWERVAADSAKRVCADDILGRTLIDRRPPRRRKRLPDEPIWTFKPGILIVVDASVRDWFVATGS